MTSKQQNCLHRHQIPSGKAITYYNPQLKVKMKDGRLVKRVRGTVGGGKSPYSGPTLLRLTLADLGYPQKPTTIICGNECAVGIANDSFTQKRSKTIDMCYHWMRDQVKLKFFKINWRPSNENLADFFTKAHPVNHHLKMMNIYTVTDQEGVLEPGYSIPYNDDNDQ